MNNTPSDGRYRGVPKSQEPGVVKDRITYEFTLREEGIDVLVARRLKELLQAQGRRWNPKKRSWENFEDYRTQLAAIREIFNILDIYPRREPGKDSNANKVLVIETSAIPRHG